MHWWRVYADGSEVDIISAGSGLEAVVIAQQRYGAGAVWTYRSYP